ncbi:MAG: EboA domain-containing protein [Actinomycetota bacterium]
MSLDPPAAPCDLWAALRRSLRPPALRWLEESCEAVVQDPPAIRVAFALAARKVGRALLDPGAEPGDLHAWTVDDAARAALLVALGDRVGEELGELYRFADAQERRAILRTLAFLELGEAARPLAEDALRTNDPRLIAAALGPFGARYLDDAAFAQAILKCVFLGIPISPLRGLAERATPELARMLAGYVHERVAAGRDVTEEVWQVIDRFRPLEELKAIAAELDSPVEGRRQAARRAFAGRASAFEEGRCASSTRTST